MILPSRFRPPSQNLLSTELFKAADPDATSPEMFRHPVRQHLKTYSLKFTVTIRFPPIPPVLELTEIRIVVDKCLPGCLITDIAKPANNRIKGRIQPKRGNVQRCEAIA